tara:strand:+ start:206 stop:451 length:246 start_codon:yes stop_codon:yes gene_type:complete
MVIQRKARDLEIGDLIVADTDHRDYNGLGEVVGLADAQRGIQVVIEMSEDFPRHDHKRRFTLDCCSDDLIPVSTCFKRMRP